MTSAIRKVNVLKNTLRNKFLSDIVERIISSFPLSYVSLQRIRNEVNDLLELFWIKDEGGKYVLVNDKFASKFQLNPSQIEGKSEEKFIPAYIINFNKALEDYIKESGSTILVEGFPLPGVSAGEELQTIEIPVIDSEGNLKAIIGIVQEKEKIPTFTSSFSLFKKIFRNYILVNKENKIKDISEEFQKTFSMNSSDLIDKDFNSETSNMPVILKTLINEFIRSEEEALVKKINIPGIPDYEFTLNFIKVNFDEYLLIIEELHSEKSQEIINDQASGSYDILLKTYPDPAFIYDKENLTFLNVNEEALKLYGYRKAEFLQLDLTDLYTPDDIQTLLEPSYDKEKEGIDTKPHRQKRKDGANIFVEVNRVQINYKNRQAYLNTIKTISDKLQLEQEKQKYNLLFTYSSDLIFITDSRGFIKSINNSVAEILDFSEDIIDSSFPSLLVDDDRGRINSTIFIKGLKEKLITEVSFKKEGNENLKLKLIVNPVLNFKSEVESYNLIGSYVKEITKEVIKEVPVEKESITSSVPEVNFLSAIFHDLLSPINVILGFVQDLTENIENPTSEQEEALQIINQNRNNLLELIHNIVEFVQTEKGEINLTPVRLKIIEIIEEVRSEIKTVKTLEACELDYGKISSSLEVETDEDKFRKLLLLLIALVHKSTGQKKLFISAGSYDEDHFSISIKDNYNSTSQPFTEKISTLFSEKSENIKIPGVFSFSHKLFQNILQTLNGEFEIINEKDKKEALFLFPLKSVRKNSDKEVKESLGIISEDPNYKQEIIIHQAVNNTEKIEPEENSLPKKTSVDLSKLSCLYIEDQLDSQMLFSSQIRDIKDLDFAVSLEQAVPMLKSKSYDFIVVDINLQGDYNGLDILRVIRTMPEYENTPVIAVTAYILPVNREVYTQAGFSDFISKPLFREDLLSSLEKILIPQY